MAAKIFTYSTTGTKFAANFMVALTAIRWVSNAAAQGDECLITDVAGNTIFESEAQGAQWNDSQRFDKQPMVNGIIVSTLTSGNVYLEID